MTTIPWSELVKEAEAGGAGEPVPEGPYRCEITKTEAKTATTGKSMIVAAFKILDGPYAGRPLYNNFVLTTDNPNALAWFFKNMASLGLGKDFFAMNPSLESVAAQLVGKRCIVSAGVKTYNNELRNEVKGISSDGQVAPQVPNTVTPSADVTPPSPATGSTPPPGVPF
jgi:hypothetical protein